MWRCSLDRDRLSDYPVRVTSQGAENLTSPADFRLGDCLVRPSLNRVERGPETIRLEPKVMDLLVELADSAGRVVSKAELIDRVWRTEFIAESALTRAVGELRRALGETAREPRYLETITKRGYRIIAEVERLDPAAPEVAEDGPVLPCAVMLGDREILLHRGENLIGRALEAAVRIDSTEVSRRHARITVEGERCTLEDLGSKNGTRVWGRLVEHATVLKDGDRIGLGDTLLIFRILPFSAATRTSGQH